MRGAVVLLCLVTALAVAPHAQGRPAWLDPYRDNADKLIKAAMADQFAWHRLAELTDTHGQRLSGSDNLKRAIVWAADAMKRDGLENVHTERVMVPRWVRGQESIEMIEPPQHGDAHAQEAANHIFSVESDSGVFAPARPGFSGSEAARALVADIGTLLAPLGMQDITSGGGGADIGPISTLGKVPMMAYSGDSTKYFTVHHTPADTVDRIEPQEVSRAAAALATMIYVVADMPQALPK